MCAYKTIANSNNLVYSRTMTKAIKLGDVATIQSGYSFRGAVVDDESGVAVVQARDVNSLYLIEDGLPKSDQDFPEAKMLRKGDVLLTSRGSFRASMVQFTNPAVATSSLFTLRLTDADILPEFLAIYLNSAQVQSYLIQKAKGATIQSLAISDLANLTIPPIPVQRQKTLLGLQQAVENQGKLLKSKLEVVNDIYVSAVNKSLKGAI